MGWAAGAAGRCYPSPRMPSGPWLTLLLLLAACRDSPAADGWPRFDAAGGVDPLVLARVRAAEAACERDEPGSLLELAKVHDANGLDNLALEVYTRCLARPDSGASAAELHFHRGRVLEELGRAEEALAAYGASLAEADDYAPVRWRRGGLLLEAGRVDEARADYERALALEPDSVPACLGLARTLLALDRPAEARTLLEAVLARRPNQRFVHGLLARVHLALGDEERAEEEQRLEALARNSPPADRLTADVRKRATGVLASVQRANDLLEQDQPREALEALREVQEHAPDELAVLQALGQALIAAGEPRRALEVLLPGRQAYPGDDKLALFAGLAHEALGAPAAAVAELERARNIDPAFAPTWLALGRVQLVLGRVEASEQALARAVALGEESAGTLLLLGEVQTRRADWAGAVRTLERACTLYPATGAHWTQLAEAHARAGDPAAAEAALTEAVRRGVPARRVEAVRKLLGNAEAPR